MRDAGCGIRTQGVACCRFVLVWLERMRIVRDKGRACVRVCACVRACVVAVKGVTIIYGGRGRRHCDMSRGVGGVSGRVPGERVRYRYRVWPFVICTFPANEATYCVGTEYGVLERCGRSTV